MRNASLLLLSLLLLMAPTASAESLYEAPMLSERVEQGELPPIEERLPVNPFVVGPGVLIPKEDLDWQVGTYGGMLRTVQSRPDWNPDIFVMANEPILRSPGRSQEDIVGNMVEEYSVNDDNTVFTFRLREGMRWSDGYPVTTADVLFAYEDVMMNRDITPAFPALYRSGGRVDGEPMEIEALDDYTFTVTFAEPYGAFVRVLSILHWSSYTELLKPKHYLQQYHLSYTPMEELEPLLEEEELDDEWWTLFTIRDMTHWNMTNKDAIGFPVLYPWVQVEAPSGVYAFERNPYYFKVDTAGNQLPYIDRLESHEVSDVEMGNMRVLIGEVDFLREDTALSKLPLYMERKEEAGYDVVLLSFYGAPSVLYLNHTYDNDAWRETVQDVRFREALNLAIDNEEIIETLYFDMASEPFTTPPGYDPQRAEELLDEIGMVDRDSEGYRLGLDGERFEIRMEVADFAPDLIPAAELLVEYFSDIDVRASLRQISPELHGQRQAANELMATVHWSSSDSWGASGTENYLPTMWAPLWDAWYRTEGESGEEPPEHIKELFEIHEATYEYLPGSPEGEAALQDLFDWWLEHFPKLILAESPLQPLIVSDRLGNVPHSGNIHDANYSGEQFYFVD